MVSSPSSGFVRSSDAEGEDDAEEEGTEKTAIIAATCVTRTEGRNTDAMIRIVSN